MQSTVSKMGGENCCVLTNKCHLSTPLRPIIYLVQLWIFSALSSSIITTPYKSVQTSLLAFYPSATPFILTSLPRTTPAASTTVGTLTASTTNPQWTESSGIPEPPLARFCRHIKATLGRPSHPPENPVAKAMRSSFNSIQSDVRVRRYGRSD